MEAEPEAQDVSAEWVYDLFVCEPIRAKGSGKPRETPSSENDQSGQHFGVLILSEEEEELWAEEGELTDSENDFMTDDEDENGKCFSVALYPPLLLTSC